MKFADFFFVCYCNYDGEKGWVAEEKGRGDGDWDILV